ASDVQYHRARLVRQATRDAGVITADGTAPAWRDAAFDRVMLDAPCTGLRALRRRPEARWRRGPQPLPALAAQQRRLLATAADAVSPGPVVAYVTCPPPPAEAGVVVAGVVGGRAGLEVLDEREHLPEAVRFGVGPYARYW